MASDTATIPPLGRRAAAMITPFTADGALDVAGAQRLAAHLTRRGGCDALVVNDATGEAATTTDAEKATLVRAVAEAVAGRASVVASVETSDTRHAVALAHAAHAAGATGLLVAPPTAPRLPAEALVRHLTAVADATELPTLVHDVPAGAGAGLTADALRRLAAHPRLVGVRDSARDPLKSGLVMADTGLAYYAGVDETILPLLALGARGYVSTVANVAGPQVRSVLAAFEAGRTGEAARRHRALLPLVDALTHQAPGAVAVKALFAAAGLPGGGVRAPLPPAGAELTARLTSVLRAAVTACGFGDLPDAPRRDE